MTVTLFSIHKNLSLRKLCESYMTDCKQATPLHGPHLDKKKRGVLRYVFDALTRESVTGLVIQPVECPTCGSGLGQLGDRKLLV